METNVFQYMPLELWKDMAERFLDPTSFGRLRQVNRGLRAKLDKESKEKMAERYTTTVTKPNGDIVETFMNRKYVKSHWGAHFWSKNNKYHRDEDLPAVVFPGTSQTWYQNGKIHRDGDKPAVISNNGSEWYQNDKKHRDGGLPAAVYFDGTQVWYRDGKIHRDGDLPAVTNPNGTQIWFQNGQKHRDGNLPALIYADGTKEWWQNGRMISKT